MAEKRKDKNRVVLRTGESYRQSEKRYSYRWTDLYGKRHSVYAKTLDELRAKEKDIAKNTLDGIKTEASSVTLNHMYNIWKEVKRGIKDTTFQNYCYMYDMFVADSLGKLKISAIKKTDVKRFYNTLTDVHGLTSKTIDSIHTVIHQIFSMALDDGYIRTNPSDNVLHELKKERCFENEKRSVLTDEQQKVFLTYLTRHKMYSHWYPIFAVMLGTGLRVGEITGLRWKDVDLENGIIDVNHTLVYYAHRIVKPGEKSGCYFAINSTKTPASKRKIPMLDFVKEAFCMERQHQKDTDIHCVSVIDGYTDFVFINRFGNVHHQGSLNKAIKRITRDCNFEIMEQHLSKTLLPHFSCHSLRHTFATRMCEYGVNIKVIQNVMGHTDISTTMNIYIDATKDMKDKAFQNLNVQYSKFEVDTTDTDFDTDWNRLGKDLQAKM